MPRRARRTRLRGGLSPAERWALTVGTDVGMPAREEYPFTTEEQARACWRRHRDTLMSEAQPGHAPCGLWAHEPESFVSEEAIRALRLNAQALSHGANEIDGMVRAARKSNRPDHAEQFEQRVERVRKLIAEIESTNA